MSAFELSALLCGWCVKRPATRREDYDGALVPCCEECATKEVPEPELPNHVATREPSNPRAAQIRAHRDRLKAAGICVNGENHGKATHGTVCDACHGRDKKRDKERRRK